MDQAILPENGTLRKLKTGCGSVTRSLAINDKILGKAHFALRITFEGDGYPAVAAYVLHLLDLIQVGSDNVVAVQTMVT